MEKDNTLARAAHDLGLAAWFGGSLMGAIGVNGASKAVTDPQQRARVANAGWERWTPANMAAIGSYLVGGTMLTLANKGRIAGQKGVASTSLAKAGLTAMSLGATAYARALGQKVIENGDVPVEDGTTPTAATPEEVAKSQKQLKVLQWAIPAHVAALIAISSKMGEQQRPTNVAQGIRKRLQPAA
ncbi:MAG TPA: hypothetical protein VM754_06395 [Actinomycetota bacterium]|nr:hypothetical protein [Actinomycetota bacterium]